MDKEQERSISYKQMMELWAWKDFQLFLDSERQMALELAINSEDLKDIQLNRGKVKQLDSISAHLGFTINDHK